METRSSSTTGPPKVPKPSTTSATAMKSGRSLSTGRLLATLKFSRSEVLRMHAYFTVLHIPRCRFQNVRDARLLTACSALSLSRTCPADVVGPRGGMDPFSSSVTFFLPSSEVTTYLPTRVLSPSGRTQKPMEAPSASPYLPCKSPHIKSCSVG